MTKIEIKLGEGQKVDVKSLVKKALQEKKGRRGANKRTPKARGSLIECGMLTKPIILEILRRHEVSIESIIMYGKSGDRKSLTIPGVPIEGEVTSQSKTITFSLSITSEKKKGVIFSTESEKQRRERQAEAAYLENLNRLVDEETGDDTRAEVLFLTLGWVAEELSSKERPLCPWHLVSFKECGDSESGPRIEASLVPLNNALRDIDMREAKGLPHAIWNCVHAAERGGDMDTAFAYLEDQILQVLCHEETLERVRSLAADSQLSTSTA